MDIERLKQFYHLNREIENDKLRLKAIRERATSTTSAISDMPRPSDVKNKIEDCVTDIFQIEEEIKNMISIRGTELKEIYTFIESIEDSRIRSIFKYRFIDNLKWKKVAKLVGPCESEASVRIAFHRYMQSCNKCNSTKQ